jgi:hypothetical protein
VTRDFDAIVIGARQAGPSLAGRLTAGVEVAIEGPVKIDMGRLKA